MEKWAVNSKRQESLPGSQIRGEAGLELTWMLAGCLSACKTLDFLNWEDVCADHSWKRAEQPFGASKKTHYDMNRLKVLFKICLCYWLSSTGLTNIAPFACCDSSTFCDCDITKPVSLEGSDPTPSQVLFPSCGTDRISPWRWHAIDASVSASNASRVFFVVRGCKQRTKYKVM